MGETELQILITAIDEASGAFASVGESMAGLSEDASVASGSVDTSLESVGLTMNSVTGEITNAILTQEQSFNQLADIVSTDSEEIQTLMLEEGISAQEAAAVIAEADAAIEGSQDGVDAAVSGTQGQFAQLAVGAGIAFAGITGLISNSLSSAQQWNETNSEIANNLKNTGSSIPLSQIDDYAAKIQNTTLFSQQQALSAEAIVTGYKNLAPQYQTITALSGDLATKMQLFTGSATADMPAAMKILTNALNDPVAGLSQLQRQAGIDLPASVVTMVKNLANAGDTAQADAVIMQALRGQVGGMAEAAANASGTGIVKLENDMQTLSRTIGEGLAPVIDNLVQEIMPVVNNIIAWTAEHPKLTAAILLVTAAIVGFLLVIGVVGLIITGVGAGFAALTSPIGLIIIIIVGLAIAFVTNFNTIKNVTEDVINFFETVFVAFFTGVGIILHDYIYMWVDLFTGAYDLIKSATSAVGTWLTGEYKVLMANLSLIWNDGLTGMATLAQNVWNTISNTFKTGVNDVIGAINGFINALDSIHINIPAIQIPGTKIGTPALDLGFSIPDIPMLAAGGIVYNPVLAMIGEQGPEAVVPLSSLGGAGGGFGGQQIVINITGGNYLDSQGATMIGNALAKQIIQQIRTRNYAL